MDGAEQTGQTKASKAPYEPKYNWPSWSRIRANFPTTDEGIRELLGLQDYRDRAVFDIKKMTIMVGTVSRPGSRGGGAFQVFIPGKNGPELYERVLPDGRKTHAIGSYQLGKLLRAFDRQGVSQDVQVDITSAQANGR